MTDAEDKTLSAVAAELMAAGCTVTFDGQRLVRVQAGRGGVDPDFYWVGSLEEFLFEDSGESFRSYLSVLLQEYELIALGAEQLSPGAFAAKLGLLKRMSAAVSRYGGCSSAEEILLREAVG